MTSNFRIQYKDKTYPYTLRLKIIKFSLSNDSTIEKFLERVWLLLMNLPEGVNKGNLTVCFDNVALSYRMHSSLSLSLAAKNLSDETYLGQV